MTRPGCALMILSGLVSLAVAIALWVLVIGWVQRTFG